MSNPFFVQEANGRLTNINLEDVEFFELVRGQGVRCLMKPSLTGLYGQSIWLYRNSDDEDNLHVLKVLGQQLKNLGLCLSIGYGYKLEEPAQDRVREILMKGRNHDSG